MGRGGLETKVQSRGRKSGRTKTNNSTTGETGTKIE